MSTKIVRMDPNSRRDFVVDWSSFLTANGGDVLFTAVWSADPGITILNTPPYVPSSTASLATVWLTGGTVGTNYRVTCRATTVRGRVVDYTFVVGVASN